jgi:hypothetical protein
MWTRVSLFQFVQGSLAGMSSSTPRYSLFSLISSLRPIGLRSSVERHVRVQRRQRYYFESNLVCYLHDLDCLHVHRYCAADTPALRRRSTCGRSDGPSQSVTSTTQLLGLGRCSTPSYKWGSERPVSVSRTFHLNQHTSECPAVPTLLAPLAVAGLDLQTVTTSAALAEGGEGGEVPLLDLPMTPSPKPT